jgi:hypothetical protein
MIAIYHIAALVLGSPTTAVGERAPDACAPGVYAVAKGGELIALPQVKADHRKVTNMVGAMLLGPLGGNKMKVKTVVAGADATTRLDVARPVFRFCFPAQIIEAGTSSDYVGVKVAASPRDYRLVRFEQAKDQRELALAAVGGFGGPKGQLSKSTVPFQAEEVAPGQYRVTLSRDLEPGQYGFLYAVSAPVSTREKDVQEQVYDFAVAN